MPVQRVLIKAFLHIAAAQTTITYHPDKKKHDFCVEEEKFPNRIRRLPPQCYTRSTGFQQSRYGLVGSAKLFDVQMRKKKEFCAHGTEAVIYGETRTE